MNQQPQNILLPDYVVCPQTYTQLISTTAGFINTDPDTRWCYPVLDHLPVLIPERATQLELSLWQRLIEEHRQKASA
jgi:uncharacterized protein YbaR (Trm112 family)